MSNGNRFILVIVGPTASGKSALAVKLALKLNGEVISADSRQVYRGLDIGTGKISRAEMCDIPHHLLDVANPKQQFSVALYKELAEKAVKEIQSRHKLPIICGGTGLYISALTDNLSIPDVPPDPKLRKNLIRKSAMELFEMLKKLDAARARKIDKMNPRRLIRAIEIAKSKNNAKMPRSRTSQGSSTSYILIGLLPERKEIRENISNRLSSRLKKGLVNEARRLHARGLSWKRMEELGLEYRYLSRYLRGQINKEEMLKKLETEIWRYAKRQMTWFKRDRHIKWFRNASEINFLTLRTL